MPLEQVLRQLPLKEELFEFLKHSYEQTHLHNPAKEEHWKTWKDKLLDDAPDLQLSYMKMENNHVIAFIFLHPVDGEYYEIRWVSQQGNTNLLPILKNN